MKKLALVSFLAVFMYGCLNYDQYISLYPDGSGKMSVEYWMSSPDSTSLNFLDRLGLFNEDSIRNEFSSEHSTIENVEVFSDTTDSTVHARIELTFVQIDSLNETKAFSDADFLLLDGAEGQKIFSQFIPPITTGFGVDGSKYFVKYVYKVSGEIITHNAHQEKNQTLTWIYSLADIGGGKTVSFTFRPFKLKETPYWIYFLSGAVLAIVIFFLFRRKKD